MSSPPAPAPAVPPLVTPADMAGLPGGAALGQDVLDVAAGDVRSACGWHIAPVTVTVCSRSGTGGPRLVLPTLALAEVLEVRDLCAGPDGGTVLTGWRAPAGVSMLIRPAGWPAGDHNLLVTMRHGYDEVPDELRGAVLALASAVGKVPVGVRSRIREVGEVRTSTTFLAETIRASGSGLPPALQGVLDRHSVWA